MKTKTATPYRYLTAVQLQAGNTLQILGSLWTVIRADVQGTKRSEMKATVFLRNYYDKHTTTTLRAPAFDKVAVLRE